MSSVFNSCIMGTSDLPDMYTYPRAVRPEGVGVHIRANHECT